MPEDRILTAGEVARRLDLGVADVLGLFYERILQGEPEPSSGRLLFAERDVEEVSRSTGHPRAQGSELGSP